MLIIGAKGQLGIELIRQAGSHEVIAVDRDELDIANAKSVFLVVANAHPDVVINAAAYTAVDKAEADVEIAYAVNRYGPANLARACAEHNIPLVHVSTDYVFNGAKQGAYVEDDPVSPLGVYGDSKAAGEVAVRDGCPKHLIFRTSWMFSEHGNNFVKTMLRLGAVRETIDIVADQFGKPTAASELARVILAVLPDASECWGTYHMAQPEMVSWCEFAEVIFREARKQGLLLKLNAVNAIRTEDYPTLAKRPANSELNCDRLESTFGIQIKPWKESLSDVIAELLDVRHRLECV
ncbi:MAG: dTDP-4-dehydrorhamnose reductase [Mariprofundaceae bacterium]